MLKRTALVTAVSAALMASAAQASALSIQVLGQPAGSGLIAQQKEQPFFTNLAENTGLDITVQYLPVDVAGVPDTDGLRVLRSGLFDIVSLRGPQVSRDEPSILGLDLIGLNTSFEAGREHVAAFYDYVDNRLQERFNAKLLGTWPAGPQVISAAARSAAWMTCAASACAWATRARPTSSASSAPPASRCPSATSSSRSPAA